MDGQSREQILSELLDGATQRAAHELGETMEDASQRWETPITQEVLRQRLFGFSVDDTAANIAEKFTQNLKNYLGNTAPQSSISSLKKILNVSKDIQISALSALATYLEQSIKNRIKAQSEFDAVLEKKETSKAHFATESHRLNVMIDECLDTTEMIVKEVYRKYINVDFVEKNIRENYREKKDAEKYLGGFLIDKVQREINRKVSLLSERLNEELSSALGRISNYMSPVGSVAPFDAQSAFLSALTGAGAAGALAGWAAVVAGGSNLGAYILAAKVVGWLSTLGISVGGPTVVMSTIAALGGPITIALGFGVLLAGGLYVVLGNDWQTRIAKKTVDQFKKQNVEDRISVNLRKYWKDTKTALNHSMDKTLKSYDDYLDERKNIISMSEENLNERIVIVKNVEGFLRSMPMLPSSI